MRSMEGIKRYSISYAPVVYDDLDGIFEYIAGTLNAPESASSLIERIENAILTLREFPARTPLAKDAFLAKKGYRTLFVENFVILYLINEEAGTVIIHRVVYGRRKYLWLR